MPKKKSTTVGKKSRIPYQRVRTSQAIPRKTRENIESKRLEKITLHGGVCECGVKHRNVQSLRKAHKGFGHFKK